MTETNAIEVADAMTAGNAARAVSAGRAEGKLGKAGGTTNSITLDVDTYEKFNGCIHCGLCLPACPTYVATGSEPDSPRGRIHLMKAVVDGRVKPDAAVLTHLDQCLICRACEPACPSSVQYGDLIEAVRPQVAMAVRGRPVKSRVLRFLFTHVFPYGRRVGWSLFPLRIAQKLGLRRLAVGATNVISPGLAGTMETLPSGGLLPASLPPFTPATGTKKGAVVLLAGCVGAAMSERVNRAAIFVLARNGFDVHTLKAEHCCGALAAHANDMAQAREFARRTVDMLSSRSDDFFVSPIAGCGAQLKTLGHVLAHDKAYERQAAAVAAKMRDITELLVAAGLAPSTRAVERVVTYHDPCHLLHAQRIGDAPREILRQIPGLVVKPLPETEICCGAAGTYNLTQPAMAATLGERKAGHIAATGAEMCATANIGCQLQIAKHLHQIKSGIPVSHVVELLAESYGFDGR